MNNKKIKIKPYEATQEFLYQPYQIAINNMKTKEEELREEWHKATDNSEESEFANTFDLITKKNIADWWLEKLRQAIVEERESVKKMVEAWKYKYDSYQTMMSTQTNFKKGEMARELSDDLISHLKQE